MNTINPKISIITPNYNNDKYLEETILSIISQNYNNLEYIIIDGGSTDNSINIIEKYANNISYWVSEKDLGQSDAINKGISKATGDIVAWLNSDDTYSNDTLSIIAYEFMHNKELDILYGDVMMFGNGVERVYYNPLYEIKDFFSRVSIHQPGVFWKRSLHDKIGYLDTSLHYSFDYDFWMRIFPNNSFNIKKIDKTLANFRLHNASKTISNPKEMYMEYRQIICRFFNSIKSKESILKELKKADIYFNENNDKYNVDYNFTDEEINLVKNIYIHNVVIQEYTFGNIYATNKIILSDVNILKQNFLIFVKNNLLIKAF
ncbi:MAG: hypothetical protein A2X12_08370 [Bacteroidetes bacterium GWE2_29_8]|nr:MAG: hypothetical protein A2X12_08370 [Bacteroidetes bacterium GWE2_29_8]OFY19151.1 MAG: hypothetical protein A2X02_00480 [Bacteroidetes bacterium GWF2_29_10]